MADVVSKDVRSKMMSGIKGKNTKPELMIRKALHKKGFRYALHSSKLPGKPDLVFPKYKAIILVNGCFWHYHSCSLFKMPSTRRDFWKSKLSSNRDRDFKNIESYRSSGWRVMIVWECALKGKGKLPFDEVILKIQSWLLSGERFLEIGESCYS